MKFEKSVNQENDGHEKEQIGVVSVFKQNC